MGISTNPPAKNLVHFFAGYLSDWQCKWQFHWTKMMIYLHDVGELDWNSTREMAWSKDDYSKIHLFRISCPDEICNWSACFIAQMNTHPIQCVCANRRNRPKKMFQWKNKLTRECVPVARRRIHRNNLHQFSVYYLYLGKHGNKMKQVPCSLLT